MTATTIPTSDELQAALLRGEQKPVYQMATSSINPISMERSVELCTLTHRRELRKQGKTLTDRKRPIFSRLHILWLTPINRVF